MTESFENLLRAAQRGGDGAVDRLLECHLPGLRAFVRLRAGKLVRAKESCSDLVQSVCREVLEDLGAFESDNEAAFKQWLYSAALHKILDRKKYWQADKRDAAREAFPGNSESDLLDAYGTITTPSKRAAAREEIARIEAAFDQLPDEYREVITRARILGMSHREIARTMNRSEEAVRMLLHRARANLARLLRT